MQILITMNSSPLDLVAKDSPKPVPSLDPEKTFNIKQKALSILQTKHSTGS